METWVATNDINAIKRFKGVDGILLRHIDVSIEAVYEEGCFFEKIQTVKNLGFKVGVSMNRFFEESMLDSITTFFNRCLLEKVDRIYFSDMAVYMMAKEVNALSCLVYNPGPILTNSMDISFFKQCGIASFHLSSEMDCEEMCQIMNAHRDCCDISIFGYAMMSVSKRLLIDSYCQEINKENVYQHRLDCTLIESTREGKMPIVETAMGTVIFTDFILDGFKEMERFKEAGCGSILIEGIFLSEDCLVDVVHRNPLDKYNLPLSDGYLYQKTNTTKEAL